MLFKVLFSMTASLSMSQNRASFSFISSDKGRSVRQTMMSGWIPMLRSSLTLCWVGLVFSSPAAPMYGTRVTWMYKTSLRPTSFLIWRMASQERQASMSPTVPPISVMTIVRIVVVADSIDAVLDFIGDVRDDLDGMAQIIAAAFFLQDRPVNLAGRDVGVLAEVNVDEAFIMTESRSVSVPSSVTKTSPCWYGLIVPGSMLI